jgi:hypothetical protein
MSAAARGDADGSRRSHNAVRRRAPSGAAGRGAGAATGGFASTGKAAGGFVPFGTTAAVLEGEAASAASAPEGRTQSITRRYGL